MKKQEAINELNKLKTGAPCSDVYKRDEAIEEAKAALNEMLPCKVGDTVFTWNYKGEIYSSKIEEIVINAAGVLFDCRIFFRPEDIGRRVFFTREEAERAQKRGC